MFAGIVRIPIAINKILTIPPQKNHNISKKTKQYTISLKQRKSHNPSKNNKNSQSLALSVEQGLTERLVLWDCLQNLAVSRHVADRPLAQPRTAQPKHITAHTQKKTHR